MEQPDHTSLRAWRAFLTAHARVRELLESELERDGGLPLAWYDVLVQLSEAEDERLRMQELARAVLLSRSGLTRLVDRMEADGLVERQPCVEDGRGFYVVLMASGRERLRRAAPVHLDGVVRHFTRHLSAEEARIVAESLERVAGAARR